MSSISDLSFVKVCCFCLSLFDAFGKVIAVGRVLFCPRRRLTWN